MNALGRYTLIATLVVAAAVAVTWPFFDGSERLAILTAGAVAWPLQVGTFALLLRSADDSNRFLLIWGAGVLGRMLVVAVVGLTLDLLGALDPTVLMMSLCAFLFGLLLLEPVFVSSGKGSAQFAQ